MNYVNIVLEVENINEIINDIDRGIQKIKNLIEKVNALKENEIKYDNQKKKNLEILIRKNIKNIFGEDSLEYDNYKYHKISHGAMTTRDTKERRQEIFESGIEQTKIMLEGLIENLEEKKLDIQYEAQKSYIDDNKNLVDKRNIFVAYSYKKEDDEFVKGFKRLLVKEGYNVLDGKADRFGSISKAILDKIKTCKYVVIIMNKRDEKVNGKYTTAAWLLEEKGAGIALGKEVIMFVEDGIDEKDIGGLQGDDQRFHFTRNNFLAIVMDFIEILNENF
jgi:hypothetical protein